MTEDPHVPLQPYPCDQIVYRAQLHSSWVTGQGRVRKQAFFRMDIDVDGISVNPTEETCGHGLTDPFPGKITLHVGRVRTLGLDVIPDSPTHGTIQGVPTRAEDDALARTLAEDLASMARPLGAPRSQSANLP